MKKQNKFIVVFIAVYIITLMSALMFFSKEIDTSLLIAGFGSVAGIFATMIGFIKYQNRKKNK